MHRISLSLSPSPSLSLSLIQYSFSNFICTVNLATAVLVQKVGTSPSTRENKGEIMQTTKILYCFVVLGLCCLLELMAVAAAAAKIATTGGAVADRNNKKNGPPMFQVRRAPETNRERRQATYNLWKRYYMRLCLEHKPPVQHHDRQKKKTVSSSDQSPLFTQPKHQGTLLMMGRRHPSSELVSRWFWGTAPIQFNHAMVGMTNPYIHISIHQEKQGTDQEKTIASNRGDNKVLAMLSAENRPDNAQLVSRRSAMSSLSNSNQLLQALLRAADSVNGELWWPQGPWESILLGKKEQPGTSPWRVLCYRQRVGFGEECYERVKEAVLNLEFGDNCRGILTVLPPEREGKKRPFVRFSLQQQQQQQKGSTAIIDDLTFSLPFPEQIMTTWHRHHKNNSPNALSIWPGGGRRLATYTRWGPGLYAVSPVSVVYETVDQAIGGTMSASGDVYSSAAFATTKGHWICGEERVSVLKRGKDEAVDVELLSLSHAAPSFWGKVAWPLLGRFQNNFFVQQMQSLQSVAAGTTTMTTPTVLQQPASLTTQMLPLL